MTDIVSTCGTLGNPLQPQYERLKTPRIIIICCLSLLLISCGRAPPSGEERLQRAFELEEQRDFAGATAELKQLLLEEPDYGVASLARARLGHLHFLLRDGDSAFKEFSRAEQLGLSNDEVQHLSMRSLLLSRDYQALLDALPNEAHLSPVQRLQFEAEARFGLQEFEHAERLFLQVLEMHPERQAARIKLAQIAVRDGRLALAEEYLDSALQANEANAQAWLYKADIRLRYRDFKAAAYAYHRVLALFPGKLIARIGRAHVALAQGNTAAADKILAALIKARPYYPSSNYLSAVSSLQQGDTRKARAALNLVLQSSPTHAPGNLLLGAIDYHEGDYLMAEPRLLVAVRQEGDHGGARMLLAASRLGLSNPRGAAGILSQWVDARPGDVQGLALLASARAAEADYTAAVALLERAGELVNQGALLSTTVEVSRLGHGQVESRISEPFSAVALAPDHLRAPLVRVMSDLLDARYQEALAAGEPLLVKMPDNPLLLQMLGAAHEGLGETRMAQVLYEKALALAPDFTLASTSLARVQRGSNQDVGTQERR